MYWVRAGLLETGSAVSDQKTLLCPWLMQASVFLVTTDLLGDRQAVEFGRGADAPHLSRAELRTGWNMGFWQIILVLHLLASGATWGRY